jgi:TolB-like protein/tetratricopeptide (TPR) repeat protein
MPARSIVVLPLVNVSPDPEQEYFSDGLSEELINVLARNPELKVTSRTSAFHYKSRPLDLPTIARELGVAHVLEGSVRKSGEQIRVTVQLVDARTDKHLWSETFDRTVGDVFELQDEVASKVFDRLRVTLLGPVAARHAADPTAYVRYLQAKRLLDLDNPGVDATARALLEEAVAIDPTFVRGWTELARASGRFGDHPASSMQTRRALVLAPDDPIAHAWLGWESLLGQAEVSGPAAAAAHFQRAHAADPTNVDVLRPMVPLLIRLGRFSDAIDVSHWLISRDPMCVICRTNLAQAYLAAGALGEAERAMATAHALAPDSTFGSAMLAWIQLLGGKASEALSVVDAFEQAHPASHPALRWLRALGHQQLGDDDSVANALVELEADWGLQAIQLLAIGHAELGDADAAFAWLEQSVDFPPASMFFPHLQPEFEPLHADPRWRTVLGRFGLLPEQLAGVELEITLPDVAE